MGRIICWPRQPNGLQGGGSESGIKAVDPSRRFPAWWGKKNAELFVLFFPGHGSFQQANYSKEIFLRRYETTTKRITGRIMPTFYPNPLLQLFKRLRHVGRRGRERGGRQLQQSDQRAVCKGSARSRIFRHTTVPSADRLWAAGDWVAWPSYTLKKEIGVYFSASLAFL